MAFLGKILKKKPGGTLFGNLIRVGAQKLSGGVFGLGGNMIPVGSAVEAPTLSGNVASVVMGLASETPQGSAIIKDSAVGKLNENKSALIMGLIALGAVLFAFLKGKK